MKATELPGLNLLRVLAALYIVVFHLHPVFWPAAAQAFFARGTSGTSLFFLLSGFLLAHLSAGRPMDDQGQRRFVWRRVARIAPANVLGLLALLGVRMLEGQPLTNWNGLAESLLLIQSWVVGDSHVLNTPTWSMSCLLFFYLIFPVLLPRLERLRSRRLVALLVGLWLFGVTASVLLAGVPSAFNNDDWTMYLHNSPLLRAPEFILGMGAALLVARRGALPAWVRVAAPLVLGIMLFAPLESAAVNNGIFAPLSLALLLAFVRPGARLDRLGRSAPVRALASASICIFLLHMTWQRLFSEWLLPHWHLGWTGWTVAADLALVLGSAVLADRWVCRPVTNLLTGRAGRRRPVRAGAAQAPLLGGQPT